MSVPKWNLYESSKGKRDQFYRFSDDRSLLPVICIVCNCFLQRIIWCMVLLQTLTVRNIFSLVVLLAPMIFIPPVLAFYYSRGLVLRRT
jgi:hypothetical protein